MAKKEYKTRTVFGVKVDQCPDGTLRIERAGMTVYMGEKYAQIMWGKIVSNDGISIQFEKGKL
jgi:hypothetical protein